MKLESISVGATIVLAAAVVGLLYTHSLFAHGPALIGVQIAAAALMLWARVTFGWRSFHAAANPTGGGLVTDGPYRWVRHPIYLAILLFVWAGVAAHASIPSIGLGLVASAGVAVRIGAEEALVIVRYPEYAEYARRTRRIIPFLF